MVDDTRHNNDSEAQMTTLSRRSLTKLAALGGVSTLTSATALGTVTSSSTKKKGDSCHNARTKVELPRQGPDVLYEPLAEAPQFENTGIWGAEPLLVSGTDAYVDGEYLYQDYIYDDHGANVTDTPFFQEDRPEPDYSYYSPPTGDIRYPTSFETYAHNAADLLEFRAQPVDNGIAYRFTLNTMRESDVTGVAVGINADGQTCPRQEWGYGLGDLGALDLDHVLVTWGTGAELDGSTEGVKSVTVDTERNQIEVIVDLDPAEETWRHYAVTGLFDTETQMFKSVQGERTDSSPGHPGEEQSPALPPVFNVAFRFDEPLGTEEWPIIPEPPGDTTREDVLGYKPAETSSGHWREHSQANALAERDISQFYADIDFGKLGAEETKYNVPETGYLNRLYVSHEDFGEGVDGNPDEGIPGEENIFLNRIQPYAVYIPKSYDSDSAHPLHVFLHGSTSSFNEVGASQPHQLQQIGDERNAIIFSPEARGPSLGYDDRAQLDVFEAWADAAARYSIDHDRVTLSGYSMGGSGTFRLAGQYPGLFAKGFPIVGSGEDERQLLPNLRNVPILMWNSEDDHLVPPEDFLPTREELGELGYRHQLCLFPDVYEDIDGHFYFSAKDEWGPAKAFLEGEYLGDAAIDHTPPQVTYQRVPATDNEELGLIHDTAYWVSDIRVVSGAESGLVDVRSKAFGVAPPNPVDYEQQSSELDPHTEIGTRWESSDEQAPRNALDVTLEEISEVTFWIEAANLNPNAPIELHVESTSESTITLVWSGGTETVTVTEGECEKTVRVCPEARAND